MTTAKNRKRLYDGKAGQLAVMSELLSRGWNVAIPEVDVGDDIFVVRDSNGNLIRVQVKTRNGTITRKGYSAQYKIPLVQLREEKDAELVFVFVVRLENKWKSFVVMERFDLYSLIDRANPIGNMKGDFVQLYFSYRDDTLSCSKEDLSCYLNNWEGTFPVISAP
jgi:hypothetical protein